MKIEVVLLGHTICHAISRSWVKGVILFKALNWVSTKHSCYCWNGITSIYFYIKSL